jgi:hypothetical protein
MDMEMNTNTNPHDIDTWEGAIAWAVEVATELGFGVLDGNSGKVSIHVPGLNMGLVPDAGICTTVPDKPGFGWVTSTRTPRGMAKFAGRQMAKAYLNA